MHLKWIFIVDGKTAFCTCDALVISQLHCRICSVGKPQDAYSGVEDKRGGHRGDSDGEPRRQFGICSYTLVSYYTEKHSVLDYPDSGLIPLVCNKFKFVEPLGVTGNLIDRCILGHTCRTSVGSHVVAVYGNTPRRWFGLGCCWDEITIFILCYSFSEHIIPVGVDSSSVIG